MRYKVPALAAVAILATGVAFPMAGAHAQGAIRTRVYAPPAIPPGMDADDVRDYQLEQMDRRHESERASLRFHQRVERHYLDPDDDD